MCDYYPLWCIFLIFLQREQENKKRKCSTLNLEYMSMICFTWHAHYFAIYLPIKTHIESCIIDRVSHCAESKVA